MIELRKDKFGYWSGDLLVTPLVTEETLAAAYLQFKADGLLDTVFFERKFSLREFVTFMLKDGLDSLVCGRLNPDLPGGYELGGIGWINNYIHFPEHTRCEVGYCFTKKVQTPKLTTLWTQLMLQWLFDTRNVDVVLGVTPEPNRAATLFARRLGFEMHGPLPMYTVWDGKPCAAYMEALTREKWDGMRVFEPAVEYAAAGKEG